MNSQPIEMTIDELFVLSENDNDEYEYFIDTPDGYQEIVNFWKKGLKETYRVLLKNGYSCTISYDHLFQLSNLDWIFANELIIGQELITDDGISEIVKCEKTGISEDVFDLTINHENHRYFTDGISSHNSGVGKSLTMANLTVNFLSRGMNVLYISLELAEKVVGKRFDSMISGIGQRDIEKNIQKVANELVKKSENMGKLTIKRMPESITTANHIRAYLKEFETVNGYIPDLICLDYLDLMMPNRKVQLDNLFIKDKFTAEEVRAIAAEYDCCLVSASQTNRASIETEDHNQGHIQGGFSKVQTADNLIMIVQTDMMRAGGEIVFKLMKTRSSAGVGSQVLLRWDPISLRITDPNKSLVVAPKRAVSAGDLSDKGTVFNKFQGDDLLGLMRK